MTVRSSRLSSLSSTRSSRAVFILTCQSTDLPLDQYNVNSARLDWRRARAAPGLRNDLSLAQHLDDAARRLLRRHIARVHGELGVFRGLVGGVEAGEVLDATGLGAA